MTYLLCKYVLFKAHIVCIIGKGAFFNYVDKIFFGHLPPYVDIFYLIRVDKKPTFLDYLPTSSCQRSLWTPTKYELEKHMWHVIRLLPSVSTYLSFYHIFSVRKNQED